MADYRPYSMIKVPSKGVYYPDKRDRFFVRFLTYEEEYILTDSNIMESGDGLKKVLESVIIDDFDVNLLVPGDVQAISLFLRSSGYGDKIDLNVTCPKCKTEQEKEVRLSDLKMKQVESVPDDGTIFNLTLPHSEKKIKLRMSSFEEEMKAEQAGEKGFSTKLGRIICQVEQTTDKRVIKELVPRMSMKDSRFLKDFLQKNTPGVDTSIAHKCENCEHEFKQAFSTGYNFLSLPPSYRENMMEQLFNISYYSQGGVSWSEAIKMPSLERIWMMKRLKKAIEDRNKQEEKSMKKSRGRVR